LKKLEKESIKSWKDDFIPFLVQNQFNENLITLLLIIAEKKNQAINILPYKAAKQ